MVRSSYHADEQSEKYTGKQHLNTANHLAEDALAERPVTATIDFPDTMRRAS